jgi:spore coat protein U domain-containing protein, fimbrial subunit CupE1/2/3/6
MHMSSKYQIALATAFALAATGAFAGVDNSKSIAVSAAVTNNCVVSAGATLDFGSYDPISANATSGKPGTGNFSVICTKGATGVLVGLGLGTHANVAQRRLSNGTDTLDYNLFQPTGAAFDTCPGTTAWDDTASKLSLPPTFFDTGSTAPKIVAVCGTIPPAQNVSAGSYSDTVVIDVTF